MTQPEALRLADLLEMGSIWQDQERAAAELRRLHEENERCREVCKATSECWRADAEKWQAQRDALLAALKMAVRQNEHDMLMTGEELRQARAAINKAEEKA